MKICPVCSTEYADDVKFCPNDGQTLRGGAPASDLVGQVIHNAYHVVEKLGEGGMGQVYKAQHVKMGREAAIKVMSPSMVHDPDAVARFNREAKNASRIQHPNVCAVYDFGETPDGLIFLAMEFIKGQSLTAVIEREGHLPVPRAVDIFVQTAEALQAAHDLDIVHRDLKPDNIMIVRGRDGRDIVKVVDFGIAKAVGGDEAGQKVTKTGLVVGTPEFMSPEQLSGDKVDGRSDLYSLALVLYQMLTGRLPFQADTVQETMVKRLTDEPARLDAVRPDLTFPAGLQAVFDTALARMPTERYQDVSKFASDVGGLIGRGRMAAMPATRSPDADARTQVMAPGEAKAAALAATRPSTARKGPRRSLVPIVVGAVVVLGGAGAGYMVLGRGDAPTPADTTGVVTNGQQNGAPPAGGQQGGGQPAGGQTSGGQQQGGGSVPVTGGGQTRPPQTGGGAQQVDLARAFAALDALQDEIDRDPRAARDSAMVLYNASSLPNTDKAMAAFIIANTYWKQGDRIQGCTWISRARTLDPATPTYVTLADGQCQ